MIDNVRGFLAIIFSNHQYDVILCVSVFVLRWLFYSWVRWLTVKNIRTKNL